LASALIDLRRIGLRRVERLAAVCGAGEGDRAEILRRERPAATAFAPSLRQEAATDNPRVSRGLVCRQVRQQTAISASCHVLVEDENASSCTCSRNDLA